MEIRDIIRALVTGSVMLAVFGLGLKATMRHPISLLRSPWLLFRSILAMNVIMPVLAAGISALLDIYRPVQIALVALMVSPVVPIMPSRQSKIGCDKLYVYGLLTAQTILAVFLLPLSVRVAGHYFGVEIRMEVGTVGRIVLVTILFPMAAGIGFRTLLPELSARLADRIIQTAFLLLMLALLPILLLKGREMLRLIGNGTLLAMILVCMGGLIVGHLLGGGEPDHRATLAIATAMRHPAFALAIVTANAGEVQQVFAALLLYFLVNTCLSSIYILWFKRWRNRQTNGFTQHAYPATPNR
jgi:BASS family bile acid:Na+ symporter